MTQEVWKYEIPMTDNFSLEMPIGAKVLCVQTQHNTPCIWSLVSPGVGRVTRSFRLAGTGHPIDLDGLTYIGTFQIYGGSLVFHVFEKGAN
jgi:hypothetical protein